MPEEIEHHIKNVQSKLQVLLKRHAGVKKENQKLAAQNNALTETNQALTKKIELLEHQVNIIKTSAGTLKDGERMEFEKTINNYIKTIDKCLLILNK